MIMLGCRWTSSSETSMLTPKLFGWISCVHCLVICGNCTTPKDVSKNRLETDHTWMMPPTRHCFKRCCGNGKATWMQGWQLCLNKNIISRDKCCSAQWVQTIKWKSINSGLSIHLRQQCWPAAGRDFQTGKLYHQQTCTTLLQHARAWKKNNAATTECLQSGAPSCHRQMTSLTWWKTFPQEPWCTSTTRAAWWQCARVRNSYLQFNTLMHGDERELLPEALRCIPPDCIWFSNFSNKANCGQEVITNFQYSKLVNVVEGFASTNGQWSMPAHHKARPFWTEAVKKQLDYVH